MLWTLVVLLLVFWLLGFAFNVAGNIIHVLLVIALVLFVVNLITGRNAGRRSSRNDLAGAYGCGEGVKTRIRVRSAGISIDDNACGGSPGITTRRS
jgi:uncharacterized membrane protein YtjA (UPF0391 family)